eukprot:SAG11_NODE_3534_length_2386_cov_3.060778_7_plen_70_part_01
MNGMGILTLVWAYEAVPMGDTTPRAMAIYDVLALRLAHGPAGLATEIYARGSPRVKTRMWCCARSKIRLD